MTKMDENHKDTIIDKCIEEEEEEIMEMSTMGTPKMSREERRYSVPYGPGNHAPIPPAASEDLHAWSIYRQNLNSDFTDSALGSSDKSPLPYGNFQLRDTTVQSILNHPRYGPKSPLGSNMYTYLKFGLPRVFPPNGGSQRSHKSGPGPGRGRVNRGYRDSHPTAGSSGYDSSDNETTRATRAPPKIRKFRSESDFRMLNTVPHNHSRPSSRMHGNIPVAALKQVNSRASIAGPHYAHHNGRPNGHHRSHSEADLLAADLNYDYDGRGYDTRDARTIRGDPYMTRRQSIHNLIYPNIQVHCLDVSATLRGVSMQAKAGDLFAVMATSIPEGTALMETLAGLKERMSGEILVNGQHVSRRTLRTLCGYVAAADMAPLDPRMSVQSTLRFHAALRGPIDNSDIKDRIDILVEDLGLSAIRAANISRLTHSEKQRLNVACQLLTQASILVLDQATNNMDIFDTFFLVEYLRQWCNGSRIIIMTLQPPTFEILSMCSGVLLLSGGRVIFSGSRSDLPRHMGSLGYPCPPFKNPADYYLDLVTLDDLSAAALLESSSRIEALANAWDRINSEPPIAAPKASLPQPVIKAGVFGRFYALCKRSISYKQPGSLLSWISRLILAAILSLIIGAIFWDVPASDPKLNLNDRLGYHHAIMTIGLWPLLLCFIRDTHVDRKYAEKDLKLDIYGRALYLIIQCLMSVIPSLCIWIAYLLPAHSMAGLYSYKNDSGIYMYLGYMLLYLMAIQTIALLCAHFMPTKVSSSVFLSLLLLFLSSVGGYMVHPADITPYWSWLEVASPQKWTTPILAAYEFSKETLRTTIRLECTNKQIQRQDIIVKDTCPPPDGTSVLADYKLLPEDHVIDPSSMYTSTIAALLFTCISVFVLTFLVFLANCQRAFVKKSKKRRT